MVTTQSVPNSLGPKQAPCFETISQKLFKKWNIEIITLPYLPTLVKARLHQNTCKVFAVEIKHYRCNIFYWMKYSSATYRKRAKVSSLIDGTKQTPRFQPWNVIFQLSIPQSKCAFVMAQIYNYFEHHRARDIYGPSIMLRLASCRIYPSFPLMSKWNTIWQMPTWVLLLLA